MDTAATLEGGTIEGGTVGGGPVGGGTVGGGTVEGVIVEGVIVEGATVGVVRGGSVVLFPSLEALPVLRCTNFLNLSISLPNI